MPNDRRPAVELAAIRDARAGLAQGLRELDLMPAFRDRTEAEIDRFIGRVIDVYEASLRRRLSAGEPPF